MASKPFRRGRSWGVVIELSPDPTMGQRRQRWITGPERKEVQREQRRLLRERDTGTSLDPTRLTGAEFPDHWLETVVRPNRAIRTYKRREGTIRNHRARLFSDLGERGYAPDSVIAARACTDAALARAVKWRMIPLDPVDLLAAPRAGRSPAYVGDNRG